MTYQQKLKRNLKLIYLANFFSALIFVIPIWVAFERRILTFTQMAMLQSILAAITIFLELPTGALADLIGRKKTIVLGWLIRAIASMYVAFASSFSMFFTAVIGFGISAALISGADTALTFDTLKELKQEDDFPKFIAKTGLAHQSGLIIATLLGGYLYRYWIGLPYFLMGITALITSFIILYMIEPKIDTVKFTLKAYVNQTKNGFKELFKTDYMKKLTIYYTFVGGITWSCLYYYNQPFATDVGFTEIQMSWVFGITMLLSSLSILLLVQSKKFLSRNRVYLGFPIIMSLALLPGIFANKTIAPILLFGVTLSGSSRFAILNKYTNKEFESKYRATAISALNMLVSFFFIIVVGFSGKIQDLYNTKTIFTLLGILTVLLVFPSGWSLVKEYRKHTLSKGNINEIKPNLRSRS